MSSNFREECFKLQKKAEQPLQNIIFDKQIVDIFLKLYPLKTLNIEPEEIILATQDEVNLLQEAISYYDQIFSIIEGISDQELKNGLEGLYSTTELIHPIECVDLFLLIYRAGKLINLFTGFNIIIKKEYDTNTTEVDNLLVLNRKIIDIMEQLFRKFCQK